MMPTHKSVYYLPIKSLVPSMTSNRFKLQTNRNMVKGLIIIKLTS